MVFLMSILVFLAGIMTYMFFPRNDQFQINMHEEEGNIVTFLNQHQAAKDYLYQMIKWNPTSHPSEVAPYGITYNDLASMMPSIMRGDRGEVTHDISDEEDAHVAAPNIPLDGYFTSSVICLEENELANCPTDNQYVMTYGYTPHWWSNKTNQKQVWLKSMLKRSHGSDNCGVFESIGDFFAINNGQKYGGIVKAPIGGKMQKVLPDNLSNWINLALPEMDRDVLICLSAIKDVYKGTPIFHWDSINNNGDGHVAGIGTPLVGSFTGHSNALLDKNGDPLFSNNYTISGIVNGYNRTSDAEFLYINGTQNIKETCSSDNCTLSVGNVSISVPLKKSYAFVYTTAQNQEDLTVYYSKPDGSKIKWIKETKSSKTSGPAFSADSKLYYIENNSRPYLLGLRIYDGVLSKKDINHNIKADRKRFGL